jgi:hypothetical protein
VYNTKDVHYPAENGCQSQTIVCVSLMCSGGMPESLENILFMSHYASEFTEMSSDIFICVRFILMIIFPRGVWVEFWLAYISSVA